MSVMEKLSMDNFIYKCCKVILDVVILKIVFLIDNICFFLCLIKWFIHGVIDKLENIILIL
jgi:hypothetical protein